VGLFCKTKDIGRGYTQINAEVESRGKKKEKFSYRFSGINTEAKKEKNETCHTCYSPEK
jgi:hypothetical protein